MKAAIHDKYGPPEVIHIGEVEKPVPAETDVLVKIHSTTVNRTDCGFRKPEYLIVRLFSGLLKPKHKILGTEFAGVVESVGIKVTNFKPGDKVFGLRTYLFGAHAEYINVKASGSIALMPSQMSFDEAAAVCDGMMLAINYIRAIDFKAKPKILINGASGSIGSAAVQLAMYYGGEVTAVCSPKSVELMKSFGVKNIIDFTTEDFTQTNEQFDVVLDSVGKSSFFKCKKILKPKGIYFSSELGYMSQNVFLPLITPLLGGKQVKFPIPTDNQQDIQLFKEIIEAGHYKAVIDRTYSLDQIIEATKYVETGQKTGNVVIRIAD